MRLIKTLYNTHLINDNKLSFYYVGFNKGLGYNYYRNIAGSMIRKVNKNTFIEFNNKYYL